MTKQLNIDQLREQYSDRRIQSKLLQLMHLSSILNECIISKDYEVGAALHGPLVPSDHGNYVIDQARKRNVPFNDARLLCLLEIFGGDLLLNIEETRIAEIQKEISNQIKNRKILLPFIYGRLLYDRMASLYDERKPTLSSAETLELLDGTPQGVFQAGRFVTGPYGILSSKVSRIISPTQRFYLQSCEDLSCDIVHLCYISTDYDAAINEHRPTFLKLLDRHRNRAIWNRFLNDFAQTAHGDYGDLRSEPVMMVIGDCLSDAELVSLLARLLDNTAGYLRELVNPLGLNGRSGDIVGGLSRAQMMQLIFLCESKDIVWGIDELTASEQIAVPASEVRRTVVSKPVCYGPYGLFAELSQYGIRIQAQAANIAPLRLRRLVEKMYNLSIESDREELSWQLRDGEDESIEEKLSRQLHSRDPRDLLRSLALARRSNVIVATEELGLSEGHSKSDARLIEEMLWKLVFDAEWGDDPNNRFIELQETAFAALRQSGIGSESDYRERITSATFNYFVRLETLLQSSLCYLVWALRRTILWQVDRLRFKQRPNTIGQ